MNAFNTFDECAQAVCEDIFNNFGDASGRSAFVLFRIFRMGIIDELPPELLDKVDARVSDLWLALAGTVGVEPAWCSRQTSVGHSAIPVNYEMSPMLLAVFDQTKLEPKIRANFVQHEADMSHYFYVQNAVGSPMIVDQEGFVRPYQVQSSIGIAGRFVDGGAFVALGFSHLPIDALAASKFAMLTPFLATLLAVYDGRGQLWH